MRIEDLARACGLNIATIETYRRAGLLPEPRTDRRGVAQYTPKISTTRVRFLRDAQAAGVDLDDLVAILTAADRGTPPDPQLRARLDGHLGHLGQRISQLRRVETELRRIAVGWPPTTEPLTSEGVTDRGAQDRGVSPSGYPDSTPDTGTPGTGQGQA